MTTNARVSVSCGDRVGLIAAITGRLFDLGGNLGDTSFAVLGGTADFFSVVEFPDGTALDAVRTELSALPELEDAVVTVSPAVEPADVAPSTEATHTITVSGGDRPGLVARLCEAFVDYRANIVTLQAERMLTAGGMAYAVRIAVHIPPETAASCLATVGNTAGSLGLSCQAEEMPGGAR